MEGEREQVKAHSGEKNWEKLSVYAIKVFRIHQKEMKLYQTHKGKENRQKKDLTKCIL